MSKLLVRGYRSISFTREGGHLFRAADDAIAQLQEALGLPTSQGGRRPVAVTTSVGVAALWLLARPCGTCELRSPVAAIPTEQGLSWDS